MTEKLLDNVWIEKSTYEKAERLHYERLAKKCKKQVKSENDTLQANENASNDSAGSFFSSTGSIAKEVAKARQQIKQSLMSVNSGKICVTDSNMSQNVQSQIQSLEKETSSMKQTVEDLKKLVSTLSIDIKRLEERLPPIAICPSKPKSVPSKKEDDDMDLFGSDSETEDAEKEKIKQARIAAYAAKKQTKPTVIAKSNIILDVKPWDDETDMKVMEQLVRKIEMDGLLWGAAKLLPLAYGINKLQISCVVEDDKVSVDALTEEIEAIEDYVQSIDIAAFNKI